MGRLSPSKISGYLFDELKMMRFLFIGIICLLGLTLNGQDFSKSEGSISYITSQNVYVRFSSTKGIHKGDTLFVMDDARKIAVLQVDNLSSISCVCLPVSDKKLAVSDKVFAILHQDIIQDISPGIIARDIEPDTLQQNNQVEDQKDNPTKSNISGRLSASSYFTNSNQSPDYNLRMRYVFSLHARHINQSKVSLDSYISFSHKNNQWSLIKDNIYRGLKIYSLAVNYEFNENTQLWLGRRINQKLSSVGAIDGAQFERKFGSYTSGIIIGSRPDWQDYRFNASLFQVGAYLSNDYKSNSGRIMQNTLSFMEQRNNWNADRRFLYFQHANGLMKDLYLFSSGEVDLYKNTGGVKQSTFDLTNLFVSLRYQLFKPLRISLSYSARNTIIYYETYKDIIDQLSDNKTFQGISLSANYRMFRKVSLGVRGSYRKRDGDIRPTKNLYSYLSYSSIPFLKASATIYNTLLETSYIKGTVYGIRFSRDILPGKLFGGLNYRYSKYAFFSAKNAAIRHTAQASLNYRIMKTLSFSVNYELSIEAKRNYNYFYINLTKRF